MQWVNKKIPVIPVFNAYGVADISARSLPAGNFRPIVGAVLQKYYRIGVLTPIESLARAYTPL